MTTTDFDPAAESAGNYAFAMAMLRLRALLTGERWATEHDEFNLVLAADLMRLPKGDGGRSGVAG